MDWALITWGVLIGMVGLLWIMVVASVQDESKPSHSDDQDGESVATDETRPHREQYERHAAA
jgi:hypothetical protein